MSRTRDPDRLEAILESATRTFIARSYRQARMSEVARDAGVAPGTLYLYFETKEALFYTVLRRAFLGDRFEPPGELPVPGPGPGAILDFVRRRFAEEWHLEALREPAAEPEGGIRRELRGVVTELYDKVERYRFAVRVIERSALTWPELFDLHFKTMRRGVLGDLGRYLERRIWEGHLRPVPDVPTAARVVLETVAWFAMHRHFAPDSETITDRVARETVLDLILHALLPTPTPESPTP
jgi:AcrR family transcriptional regulator